MIIRYVFRLSGCTNVFIKLLNKKLWFDDQICCVVCSLCLVFGARVHNQSSAALGGRCLSIIVAQHFQQYDTFSRIFWCKWNDYRNFFLQLRIYACAMHLWNGCSGGSDASKGTLYSGKQKLLTIPEKIEEEAELIKDARIKAQKFWMMLILKLKKSL